MGCFPLLPQEALSSPDPSRVKLSKDALFQAIKSVDVYAFGCMITAMMKSGDPYHEKPNMKPFTLMRKVSTNALRPLIPPSCPERLATAATLCMQYYNTLRYAALSARAYTIPDRPAMVPHCSPCSPPSIPSWVISKVRLNTALVTAIS
mgnify:CR=1 FL=1